MVKRVPVMDLLLTSPPTQQNRDLAKAIAAVDRRPTVICEPIEPNKAAEPTSKPAPKHGLQATSTRRVLVITALGGLLIASITVLTSSSSPPATMTSSSPPRGADAVAHARSGDCLSWPKNSPEDARVVDCGDTHLFEVAESVTM